MYLKKLEIIGFKSFAGRAEFEFSQGITAIVGPNGSGKSNVTDAIRWVLGEQSARMLRGTKMEDVIFAGSDARKPIGYCEVSITLGNERRQLPLDYSEVVITRRVYRSGESEYFLNKQACRLKEIHELLMDTGIGKDTYSVIGQGKIDEILSNKSDERRSIFEDTAGIVKYKIRKKDAERKLEGTEQNLVRIHDVIYELENQVGPLAEQVAKAHEYKLLTEKLEKNEVGLYVHKIEKAHEAWEDSRDIVKTLEEENVILSSNVNMKEAALEQLAYQLTVHEEEWVKEQENLLHVSGELEKADGERRLIHERSLHLADKKKQLSERDAQLQEQMRLRLQEKEILEQRLQEKDREIIHAEMELGRAESDSVPSIQKDQCALLEKQIQETQTCIAGLESELTYTLSQCVETEEKITQLEMQKANIDEQIKKNEVEESRFIQQRIEVDMQIRENSARIDTLRESRDQYERFGERLSHERREAEQTVTKLKSQLDMLQGMEADHTGFFHGVKEILLARDRGLLNGVHGAVSQLIKVSQEYEVAIETALGGSSQHLVVNDKGIGRKGIEYLKERRLGRATFLPLDVIQDRYVSKAELAHCASIPGFIGIASDLIFTEQKYEVVVRNLLGLVVIAKDLPAASKISHALKYRHRVVTLDGDVMNPGGSMSGGSRQRSKTQLLSRPRQLDELRDELEAAVLRVKAKVHEIQLWNQKQQTSNHEKEALRQDGEMLRLKKQDMVSMEREWGIQSQALQKSVKQISLEWEYLVQKKEKLETRRDEIIQKIDYYRELIGQLEEQRVQFQLIVAEQEAQKIDQREQITTWKVELARLNQEKSNIQENLDRIQLEVVHFVERQDELIKELRSIEEHDAKNHFGTGEMDQYIQEKRVKKEYLQQKLSALRQQREEMGARRTAEERIVRRERIALRNQEGRLKEQEVRKTRLDVELNYFLQKLSEEYGLSFERARQLYKVPDQLQDAEKEAALLKESIIGLGEVHLGSIDEHERLTKRLAFLQEQQKDLLDAKKSLYTVILQVEEEMGNRFLDVFTLIRMEFQKVFTEIFGGGSADLSLSDPDKLLETGIEIVVQPPGKKRTMLSLLSGGERALVALVLLFAILKVKPVPFCVFDEVDAALDEANLVRFNEYLCQFSHQTQFVLITHRKRTMEFVNVLYGVTMQESGVSQLVSVQLDGLSVYQQVASGKDNG